MSRWRWLSAAAVLALAALTLAQSTMAAESRKIVFAVPGIPPIFSSVLEVIADKEGFFKKYGADVEVKFFESGTAAARALITGDIDLAASPTPLVTAQISNADANIVAIYGQPSPDFLLASVDPSKTQCKDLAGQPVGVDAIGGARSVALGEMLRPCGITLQQVEQVPLPSTGTQEAMIAGRITFGVIHLDEIPVLESQGKKVTIITSINKSNPVSHFGLFIVRRDRLAANREGYVRLMAGIIAAAHWIRDPKNLDKAAEIATVTGRTKDEAKAAIPKFNAINFWPADTDGLDRTKLEAVIATQVKTGNIKPGKTPVTYDRLVDRSVWRDANAMVMGKK